MKHDISYIGLVAPLCAVRPQQWFQILINKKIVVLTLLVLSIFCISFYKYVHTKPNYGSEEALRRVNDLRVLINNMTSEYFNESFHTKHNNTIDDTLPSINDQHVLVNTEGLNNKNILDGCYHVYLDIGSNIGVQVRKLYEPEKYPNASIHSIFNSQLGTIEKRRKAISEQRKVVCAVGFEPNSHHTKYLKEIESSYNKCGWRVTFLTETAVSDHNGITRFYTDEAYAHLEWGGGILPPDVNNIAVANVTDKTKQKFRNVKLVRLSEFLKNVVGTRNIPTPSSKIYPPKVLVKMDIEGSEVDVIPDLIFSGGLQYINIIMVEWHERLEKLPERKMAKRRLESVLKLLSDYSQNMKDHGGKFDFKLVIIDDETYATSKFDLPNC